MIIAELEHKCITCGSEKIIKHGKTANGTIRLRCKDCNKTWAANKMREPKPDIHLLTEKYLNGLTFRELVPFYHSSPLRINQKIRETLAKSPDWETYLDTVSHQKNSDIIYLLGKSFACNFHPDGNEGEDNYMYLAIAVDGLSSMIVSYEIDTAETPQLWDRMFERMKSRGITSKIFMSNGNKNIVDATAKHFPEAETKINYYRAFREKEIECCLSKLPLKHKLVHDAFTYYNTLENQLLQNHLRKTFRMDLREALMGSYHDFIASVNKKSEQKTLNRVDCLAEDFKARFERFHMIKDDPRPIINGWIALKMLERLEFGSNRLSLYNQRILTVDFMDFTQNVMPQYVEIGNNYEEIKDFVIEVGSRVLNMPLNISKCGLDITKCEHLSYLFN